MAGESYRSPMLLLVVPAFFVVVSGSCIYDRNYDTFTLPLIHRNQPCPSICECEVCKFTVSVDCAHRNLTLLPNNMSDFTRSLSLRGNRFGVLARGFLAQMNSTILFNFLDMQECSVVEIQAHAFSGAGYLVSIDLGHNDISTIEKGAFDGLPHLQHLFLQSNKLRHIHGSIFSPLPTLIDLELSDNFISKIKGFPFSTMKHLSSLSLAFNQLSSIPADMFDKSAKSLEWLYLDNQRLLNNSGLMFIDPTAFQHLISVAYLDLHGNSITSFDKALFTNMVNLVDFRCDGNHNLEMFPNLEGLSHIETVHMHMTDIQVIPGELCKWTPNISYLDMAFSNVKSIPSLSKCTKLQSLYLDNNVLTHEVLGRKLSGLSKLLDLTLSGNELGRIDDNTFFGMTSLEHLDLSLNPISDISSGAFSSFQNLQFLNLKATEFATLPTNGLLTLEILITESNTELTAFPDIKHFPKLRIARLNYPYHCCLWRRFILTGVDSRELNAYEVVYDSTAFPAFVYDSENNGFLITDDYTSGNRGFDESSSNEYTYHSYASLPGTSFPTVQGLDLQDRKLECSPLPNALTPCDDLLEHWWLRLFVWLFMFIALGANMVVFIVTLRSQQQSTQAARFLVMFLSIADFSLGLYLAFIAFVDALTRGEYAQQALEWRVSRSCKAAGFFAIFGSVLSIWTLTAITLDRVISLGLRCYKISKFKAWIAMSVGVSVAITVAVLPLVGVSRYTDVGVCLPFDVSTNAAKSYVTFLLVLPIVAIVIITCSYVKLYRAYSRSSVGNANGEMRVAFRVALLVIFNCACWLPIAVIGLLVIYGDRDEIVQTSALEGHDSGKISMFVAKVLVAIFFPINAVFDPFFYVISTPFFWRNMTWLLKKFTTRIQSGNNSNTLATTAVEATVVEDPGTERLQVATNDTVTSV